MSFTRAAHDWEVKAFASFFRVLHLTRVRIVGEDKGPLLKRVCLV